VSGTIWIPGAERITPSTPGGTITSTAPPRVVWHSTEADPGTQAVWNAMIRVLRSKGAEPNVLYDPVTDRLGQFFGLNLSGRALKNDGATRTNRVGKVCIQVEVIARSAKPFTGYWKPGPNFRALMAAIRSHGIPDSWPAGPPPKFIESPPHNVPENDRDRATWTGKGGHFSHSQIPANDHGDPGAISVPVLFAAGKPVGGSTATPPEETMAITDADAAKIAKAVWSEILGPTGDTSSAENHVVQARAAAVRWGTGGALSQQLNRIEADTDRIQ
jgi:hypothetical protein